LVTIDPERLLQRFLRYVRVDTTADETAGVYPSSPGQLELGRMIADELRDIGLVNVEQNRYGIVTATLPGTTDHEAPAVALCAHLDTSPETTGKNVQPQVIRDYAGGDLVLSGDPQQVIRTADNPELGDLHGCTLVTTDGTTLLGGDDKAGLAVIVEAVAMLQQATDVVHAPLRICFTCDEEIGRGVDHVDVAGLNAAVCYTLDGAGAGDIDVETFSADLAIVKVRGVNIHPSIAKDRMVNAIRAAGDFLGRLPQGQQSPETTADRDGFLHPYGIEGGVAEATVRIILRDFDTEQLAVKADLLRRAATETMASVAGCEIEVNVTPQYRNLGDGLVKEPRAAAFATEAHRRLGREAQQTIVRGGTDGSLLTEQGLPTPNLSTGQHNPHSPLEWACLDEMVLATEVLIELAQVWATEES